MDCNQKQRHSVSDWLYLLVLACAVLLGLYIDKYEVDQRPTPRAIFNLAGAYCQSGDLEKAIELWRQVADYEKTYGVNYGNTMPHGLIIQEARKNLSMYQSFDFKNDPLFKRGKSR